jgi:hypothetical protein
MVATEGLDEVHVVCPVTSPVPSFGKVPVAENCWVLPGWMLVLVGLILTPTTSLESRKNLPQLHPVTEVSSTTASTVAGSILIEEVLYLHSRYPNGNPDVLPMSELSNEFRSQTAPLRGKSQTQTRATHSLS